MTTPIIGSTRDFPPERLTLSEARKREAGKELSPWQPISSAPKDESEFIAEVNPENGGGYAVISYDDKSGFWRESLSGGQYTSDWFRRWKPISPTIRPFPSNERAEAMNAPVIGRTWNVVPERTTLTEARKLIDGRDVYLRAAMAKAGNTLLDALKTLGGSNA